MKLSDILDKRLKIVNEQLDQIEGDLQDETMGNGEMDQQPMPPAPAPEGGMENEEGDIDNPPDPEDVPENDDGIYLSKQKLAELAQLMINAAKAEPMTLPDKLSTVTSTNAVEAMKTIQKILSVGTSTDQKLSDDLRGI